MKHGTICFVDTSFRIEAPPHVSIQLRRVFGGAQRYQAGVFDLAATPAHAYDLDWFRLRHPLDINPAEQARFDSLVAIQRRKLEAIAAIDEAGYVPREFELAIPAREYQRIGADLALRTGSLLIADEIGTGKQHPVDAKVLTPGGYVEIGTLRPGDFVIGSDGRPTAVTGVHPQGVKPSYRVRLGDGASVEAGPDHLWAVEYWIGGRRLHRIVVSTDQIRTGARIPQVWPGRRPTILDLGRTHLYVPMLSAPVEFAACHPPPLPPYLVGQLIANGSLAHGAACLTCNTDDSAEIMKRLSADGVRIGAVQVYGQATRIGIPGVMPAIRALGMDVLSGKKRIPLQYTRAAVGDRIALLHGLMDGDGSISEENCRVTYHTTSHGLAEDVRDLVEQLGGIATVRSYDRSHEDKPTDYPVRVRLPPSIRPFTTSRKSVRHAPRGHAHPTRRIVGVEYVRDVDSVCISIAAADRLYATEHALLTHNTVTAICAMTAPGVLPVLVVTMTHLMRQWERELARFAPALRVHRLRSRKTYDFTDVRIEVDPATRRRRVVHHKGIPDVVISNYQRMDGWVEMLSGKIRSLILDEAQELRHSDSNGEPTRKYAAARALREGVDLCVGLSATPIYGYGEEIFNVMGIVAPGQLGLRSEFLSEWCGERSHDGKSKVADPAALGTYLREVGLMIRRTRRDIGREIPSLTVVRHVVECDTSAIDRVMDDVSELARRIIGRIGKPLERMQNAAEIDWRLRQATGMGKAPAVAEFVRLLVESGERVLLGGWHHSVYQLWQRLFDSAGIRYATYTGKETEAQKDVARKRFVDGEVEVLILSNRSGAGLDGLQFVCRTVVTGELDWSPQVIQQFAGRAHRDGQTDPVMHYVLVAEEGSDPVIADVLGIKEAQSVGILDPSALDVPVLVGASDDHIRRLAESVLQRKPRAA